MGCFLLNTYEVNFFVLHASYGEVPVHVLVRITPWHERNRRASRPVPPSYSDIRCAQVLQPPDSSSDILRGSYRLAPQSPASSQTAPIQALIHNTTNLSLCQSFFLGFLQKFCTKQARSTRCKRAFSFSRFYGIMKQTKMDDPQKKGAQNGARSNVQ